MQGTLVEQSHLPQVAALKRVFELWRLDRRYIKLWEEGPPSQIFGKPLRKETHDFIFRVRSWEWEINGLAFDFPGMTASLDSFCARQFLGRRITNRLNLAVEEIVMSCLIPAARSRGIAQPGIKLTIVVAESGETASLEVDCGALVQAGLDLNEASELPDEISTTLLSQILSVQSFDEDASVIQYTVE